MKTVSKQVLKQKWSCALLEVARSMGQSAMCVGGLSLSLGYVDSVSRLLIRLSVSFYHFSDFCIFRNSERNLLDI